MQKVVHELPKILQLSLARIIEMENNDVPMTFLDPAVESILVKSQVTKTFKKSENFPKI